MADLINGQNVGPAATAAREAEDRSLTELLADFGVRHEGNGPGQRHYLFAGDKPLGLAHVHEALNLLEVLQAAAGGAS